MKRLTQIARWIDALNEKVGIGAAWLTTLLVLVVCFDVFTRYVLNFTYLSVQELEWHLFAVIFLMGAAYTLKHDQHVRVDLIYSRLRKKTKAWINLFGSLFLLLPFCLMVVWVSLPFVENSLSIREGSPNSGGLPARYALKSVLPLAFLLLTLQGISLAIRSVQTIAGKEKA